MELTATPRLSSGCRLHPTEAMLLIPEGALKLSGPARDILLEVDGAQTVGAIIERLLVQYPGTSAADIGRDVQALLDRMQQRGVVRV
jgi:pyrroloquinoline quinone biosynthesis protein D